MKPLVCEMCGSADLVKTDGVFQCQHCGTKYSVEECEDFFYEVSDILTSTSGLSGDVRVSAVTNSIKEVFEGYGIDGMYVPESLTEDVANKLIEDIDSFGGEVTFDDVKDYFEEYINDGGDIFDYLPQE